MATGSFITEARQYIDHYGMFKNQANHKIHDGNAMLYFAHCFLII